MMELGLYKMVKRNQNLQKRRKKKITRGLKGQTRTIRMKNSKRNQKKKQEK
jgi:hypothetical protein